MSTAANIQTAASENEIVITRQFNAPRDLVWKVWNEPEHIEKWFGPEGFSTRVKSMDFRQGGKWEYVMIGPDGAEYPCSGIYLEIEPIEKVVSTDEFGEEYTERNPDMSMPKITSVTTLFEDHGTSTRVVIKTLHATAEDRKKHEAMGVEAGWNSSFEKMDAYLAEVQN
ncbi:MAG TPA: SRPBCC domain-containing protein [Pyrinomonadaceae bacterium]|nr:SRPBCC domain-containing protein [Pyrinomonadaceae bacterium]